jgi:hypothetical protein
MTGAAAVVAAALLAAKGGAEAPLPDACRGKEVDLYRVLAEKACEFEPKPGKLAPAPPESALKLEVRPAQLTLRSGEGGAVTVALRNTTAAPMRLELDVSIGVDGFELQIMSGERRADVKANEHCGQLIGEAFSTRFIAIELAPGGEARARVEVWANVSVENAKCASTPQGMRPGKYELRIASPVADRTGTGITSVRRRTVSGALVVKPAAPAR